MVEIFEFCLGTLNANNKIRIGHQIALIPIVEKAAEETYNEYIYILFMYSRVVVQKET